MNQFKALVVLNLITTVLAEDPTHSYNYKQNGADWGATYPLCANGSA